MEPSSIMIASGLSILVLANIPQEMLSPNRYDDVTLKGCMAVAIIFLVYSLVKLLEKLDKKDVAHKDEIRRITEIFIAESKRREEDSINAQNLMSEKIEGMTFGIEKMNNFCDTMIRKITEEVLSNGLSNLKNKDRN